MTRAAISPHGPIDHVSPTELTDMEVLRRFASGQEPAAFAEIVRRHAAFVFSTCLRVLGDPGRAEDVSQETFFRLMRRPHEIRQSVGAWLHRTATHLSLDVMRSDSARRRRELNYIANRDRQASTWSELSPAVDQALSELPEKLRVLMVQHYLLGKTQAELATQTGQSPATICRHIQQGLEGLRQRLRLKGIHALPAALGALLLHASARQAPASLTMELGKMGMFHSLTTNPPARMNRIDWSLPHYKILLFAIIFSAALFWLELIEGNWNLPRIFSAPAAVQPDTPPPRPAISINVGRTVRGN